MDLVKNFLSDVLEVDEQSWDCRIKEDLPIQDEEDTVNCGVYLCHFAERLGRYSNLSFSGIDMSFFRSSMASELSNGELDHSKYKETFIPARKLTRTITNTSVHPGKKGASSSRMKN